MLILVLNLKSQSLPFLGHKTSSIIETGLKNCVWFFSISKGASPARFKPLNLKSSSWPADHWAKLTPKFFLRLWALTSEEKEKKNYLLQCRHNGWSLLQQKVLYYQKKTFCYLPQKCIIWNHFVLRLKLGMNESYTGSIDGPN